MAKPREAFNWLKKNSETLGRKYKDQWVLVGPKGVEEHSRSYAKIASKSGSQLLLVKVPRNPQAAYAY